MVQLLHLIDKNGEPFTENQLAVTDVHQQERIAAELGITVETFRERLVQHIPLDSGNVLSEAAKEKGWKMPDVPKAA